MLVRIVFAAGIGRSRRFAAQGLDRRSDWERRVPWVEWVDGDDGYDYLR